MYSRRIISSMCSTFYQDCGKYEVLRMYILLCTREGEGTSQEDGVMLSNSITNYSKSGKDFVSEGENVPTFKEAASRSRGKRESTPSERERTK